MKKKHRFGRILLRILGALLALLLLAAAALLILPLTEGVDRSAVPGSADWMAELSDDLQLSDLVLPGSHDSATQYVQLAFFSKFQGLSIGEQLEAGCRYLDIRLGDAEKGEDFPKLMHGFTKCKTSVLGGTLYLDEVLSQCYAFLTQHPTETIVFAVKHEHGDASTADFETVLDGFTSIRPGLWLLSDTIPTLGEARGRLVLMRRYEDEARLGERAGIPLLWLDQKGSEAPAQNVEPNGQGAYTLWVQDRFEYDTENKWTAFEKGMATAEEQRQDGDLAIHFLSTKGPAAYGHPFRYAKMLNARLLRNERLSGWIVLDFFDAELAGRIYSMNFHESV